MLFWKWLSPLLAAAAIAGYAGVSSAATVDAPDQVFGASTYSALENSVAVKDREAWRADAEFVAFPWKFAMSNGAPNTSAAKALFGKGLVSPLMLGDFTGGFDARFEKTAKALGDIGPSAVEIARMELSVARSSVSAVPIPAPLMLLLAALGALGLLRFRHKRRTPVV